MDPQPGTSRSQDARYQMIEDTERPLKQYKLDIEANSPTPFDYLPDEIVLSIFKYLSTEENLQVQRVCHRWYDLARTKYLWKYVKLSSCLSPSSFIAILSKLPSSVLHLRLTSHPGLVPISLLDVMAKLNEQCPFLNSFILEYDHLVRDYVTHVNEKYEFFNGPLSSLDEEERLSESLNKYIQYEFCKEKDYALLKTDFPELKILSLKDVLLSNSDFFSIFSSCILPKIMVLDLSYSQPLDFVLKNVLFSTLTHLEELYLAGWTLFDEQILHFLKNAKKLRILDLESSCVGNNTVLALKQNNIWLEELYLSCTKIGDIRRSNKDKEFFPHLKALCVEETSITGQGIENLLTECPSLRLVNVSNTDWSKIWYEDLSKDMKERVILDGFKDRYSHNHSLKSKHCNF